MDEIAIERETINGIDKEMAELFRKRMEAVRNIGNYKRSHALPILDSKREQELLDRCCKNFGDDETLRYYKLFQSYIMELSKKYQRVLYDGISVGYSGVEGAFAQIASSRIFPNGRLSSYIDFAAAYAATESGECECCVLPVENSTAGDVGQVMDLMFSGSLYVNGVYNLPIRQNLLAPEGATPDTVKTVISHPQALSQCTKYIKAHGYVCVQATNTAVAAKEVALQNDKSKAAIASRETAELYGLKVIDHDINEMGINTTRFAALSANKCENAGDASILFFTVRNEAGALAQAINIIGKYGFNMKSLRSRPMRELAWQYYFYCELDGNVNSKLGDIMLSELSGCCDRLKVAGTFTEHNLEG